MKNIVNNLDRIENDVYRTSNISNAAGGKAWSKSNAESLMQLAMTGTLTNTFYASDRKIIEGAVELVKAADAKDLANAIIAGRNEGFIRAFNIMGLVYLSQKDSKIFKKTFPKVIRTGGDLEDFINMCHKVRGFGRSIKTAMKDWIRNKTNPYYAQKYKRMIADAINITHFPCKEDPIYDYILNYYNKEVSTAGAIEKYPALKALDDVKVCIKNGDNDKAMHLIEKYRLDVASVFGIGKIDNCIWDSLAKSMPVMMFTKYIDKLDRAGVFTRNPDLYKEKISVKNLKGAKVFPFRLYTVYNNITNTSIRNHLADVLNDYIGEYDWGKYNELSWCIAPDISGSMISTVKEGSKFRPSMVAGLLTGFFYKGLSNAFVLPWGTQVHDYQVPRADSVLTHIKTIDNARGGGTNMYAPVDHLINTNKKVDVFLGITDSMEYGNTYRNMRSYTEPKGWLDSWKRYKKEVNPDAIAILIRVDSYNSSPMDEKLKKSLDIYQVYGWHDNVFKFMDFII